jgi:hypothetical protein
MFQKVWLVWFALLGVGCGVSPEQASEGLDAMLGALDSHEHCLVEAREADGSVEKAYHPPGYGTTTAAVGGCQFPADGTDWPGGKCYAPDSLQQRIKLLPSSVTTSAWTASVKGEMTEVRDLLNSFGNWDASVVTGEAAADIYVSITTERTGQPELLGATEYFSIVTYLTDWGGYKAYGACNVYIFKKSTEANQFYAAASASEKGYFRANLANHELGHCVALAHNPSSPLMTNVYFYPGPRFTQDLTFVAQEQAWLADFSPAPPAP